MEQNKEIKEETKKVPDLGQETIKVCAADINLNDPKQKVPGIRLNIGSGADYKPHFLNVDKYDSTADVNWDIANLPLRNNSVSQIICYSVLEHLPQADILRILKEFNRVLKVGGNLILTVPDMVSACERFLKDPEDDYALARIYGHQATEGQFHKSGFTPKKLFNYCGRAGFKYVGIGYFDELNKVKHILVEAVK